MRRPRRPDGQPTRSPVGHLRKPHSAPVSVAARSKRIAVESDDMQATCTTSSTNTSCSSFDAHEPTPLQNAVAATDSLLNWGPHTSWGCCASEAGLALATSVKRHRRLHGFVNARSAAKFLIDAAWIQLLATRCGCGWGRAKGAAFLRGPCVRRCRDEPAERRHTPPLGRRRSSDKVYWDKNLDSRQDGRQPAQSHGGLQLAGIVRLTCQRGRHRAVGCRREARN